MDSPAAEAEEELRTSPRVTGGEAYAGFESRPAPAQNVSASDYSRVRMARA